MISFSGRIVKLISPGVSIAGKPKKDWQLIINHFAGSRSFSLTRTKKRNSGTNLSGWFR